ncbi:MAG TPA: hypothetical protein VMU53_11895 [Candidatus Sulfotelmatobacter sp.]|nr:hypothetical protein [Candidatus Sulfotelmatobacter sp.]
MIANREVDSAACIISSMEFTPAQADVLKRLFAAGFRPIAIPPYESVLCVHRGECAALLTPVENGGLRLMAPVTLIVDGNLSVRLKKPGGDVFVWKKSEVAATEERLRQLEAFREELEGMLEVGNA